MKQIWILAACAALATTPAMAQTMCEQNDQFLVISQERSDAVGSDFIIREPAQGKIACRYQPVDGDRLLESEDALYLAGLAGAYLVLTRSTGPDGDLVIYDLRAELASPVVDVPADEEVVIEDGNVTFWERTQVGTAGNCPQFAEHAGYGFGSVIAEERRFDQSTGETIATGESRCSATQ